jgi:hypothetical protein
VAALAADAVTRAGTAAGLVIDHLKVNAVVALLGLRLHEVVQPANANDTFTAKDERLTNLAAALPRDLGAHVPLP